MWLKIMSLNFFDFLEDFGAHDIVEYHILPMTWIISFWKKFEVWIRSLFLAFNCISCLQNTIYFLNNPERYAEQDVYASKHGLILFEKKNNSKAECGIMFKQFDHNSHLLNLYDCWVN